MCAWVSAADTAQHCSCLRDVELAQPLGKQPGHCLLPEPSNDHIACGARSSVVAALPLGKQLPPAPSTQVACPANAPPARENTPPHAMWSLQCMPANSSCTPCTRLVGGEATAPGGRPQLPRLEQLAVLC